MIFSLNEKKEKLANLNTVRISSMLSVITKSQLMQCKKYINRLKESKKQEPLSVYTNSF